jgi:hypothetical protein
MDTDKKQANGIRPTDRRGKTPFGVRVLWRHSHMAAFKIRVHPWLSVVGTKNKNPTAGLAVGVCKSLSLESKPDCHAAQKQRVVKQQSAVQFAFHGDTTNGFT